MSGSTTLVVGLGSPHGDDRVGWSVVERLQASPAEGVVLRLARTPADLLDGLEGVGRLIICDGCRGSGSAGQVRYWRWPAAELQTLQGAGSHDFSLAQVLELADALGRLPPLVEIWTVEIGASRPGEPLSPELEAVLPSILHEVECHIARAATPDG